MLWRCTPSPAGATSRAEATTQGRSRTISSPARPRRCASPLAPWDRNGRRCRCPRPAWFVQSETQPVRAPRRCATCFDPLKAPRCCAPPACLAGHCRCPSTKPVFDAKGKKCYPQCPSDYVAPKSSPNYCSKICPKQFPVEKSFQLCVTLDGKKSMGRSPKAQVGSVAATSSPGRVVDRDNDKFNKTCPPSEFLG